ncbi:sulfatase-like hydrolase/transferase [Massilia jejuensis]|uniref:Sulfatase-like hydrolase/transferase n=1 Tax=Massilia jejuensis TaxID=648894 RepID=A0ABW0PL14_9BURK
MVDIRSNKSFAPKRTWKAASAVGLNQYRLRGGLEEPIAGPSRSIGLPPEHPTLPSLLKKAGYRTALFGKWHLGFLPVFSPLKSGYDVFFGDYGGGIDYFTHKARSGAQARDDLYEGEVPVQKVGYYTDLLAERAVEYIGQQKSDNPFFLSLHFTAPHWPWEGPQDEQIARDVTDIFHYDGGNLATYAKMVTALDAAVGRVLAALQKRGLADNTIIVFTSDNGGERFSRTWPFSGQKTELLEGGIRVPAIVRWPRRLAAGQVSEQVAIAGCTSSRPTSNTPSAMQAGTSSSTRCAAAMWTPCSCAGLRATPQ